ncbi:hypothetical protein ACQEVZ_24500 [Dactylosporangium sp. CA-152071]|uniref:hypothetical protein n=1 Tax=Dactylosporangium sp. CA-152071 TaxID=3239933 RepID=UPI003D943E55
MRYLRSVPGGSGTGGSASAAFLGLRRPSAFCRARSDRFPDGQQHAGVAVDAVLEVVAGEDVHQVLARAQGKRPVTGRATGPDNDSTDAFCGDEVCPTEPDTRFIADVGALRAPPWTRRFCGGVDTVEGPVPFADGDRPLVRTWNWLDLQSQRLGQ